MKVENVIFNDDLVKKMKKREFIEMHKNLFFLDRPLEDREKMLAEIYDDIKVSSMNCDF